MNIALDETQMEQRNHKRNKNVLSLPSSPPFPQTHTDL